MALSSRERNLLVFLAIVVAAAGAFFFLTRGGGGGEQAGPSPSPQPSVPVPSPQPQVPRFQFFAGRDPFVPLVVAGVTGGGGGEAPSGEVSPAPPGAEQQEQGGTTVGGHHITLIDVFTTGGQATVQVEVDGKTYTVTEGETFAKNFKVVSIHGGCADFLFGDESFTLCEPGERK